MRIFQGVVVRFGIMNNLPALVLVIIIFPKRDIRAVIEIVVVNVERHSRIIFGNNIIDLAGHNIRVLAQFPSLRFATMTFPERDICPVFCIGIIQI